MRKLWLAFLCVALVWAFAFDTFAGGSNPGKGDKESGRPGGSHCWEMVSLGAGASKTVGSIQITNTGSSTANFGKICNGCSGENKHQEHGDFNIPKNSSASISGDLSTSKTEIEDGTTVVINGSPVGQVDVDGKNIDATINADGGGNVDCSNSSTGNIQASNTSGGALLDVDINHSGVVVTTSSCCVSVHT